MFSKAIELPPEQTSTDASTLQRIFKNALEHFSRFGYAGASVREITHASRVTKPTLYYYFKNKEELYKKLADSCFEEILEVLKEASIRSGTVRERVVNSIQEYSRLCAEKTSVVRFVHQMMLSQERQNPDVGVASFVKAIREHFSQLVQTAVEKGEVSAEKAAAVTYAILGIFNLRVESLLISRFQPSEPHVIEDAIALVLACAK